MAHYTTKQLNPHQGGSPSQLPPSAADRAHEKRRATLTLIRQAVLFQPRHLQDYDREITMLAQNETHCLIQNDEAGFQQNALLKHALESEYIAAWQAWQDDLAYVADTRNDCTCTDGRCLFCITRARVKRWEKEVTE